MNGRRRLERADSSPTASVESDALAEVVQGDCLTVLAARPADERFELVYVDPPFNVGYAHGARSGLGDRASGPRAYGDAWGGLDAFLEMLLPRLVAAAARLSDRGSLWVQLDARAVHDVKVALCAELGRTAFHGEVIWVPGNGARGRSALPLTHQTILVFAPGELRLRADAPELREPYAATSLERHFRQVDSDGRRYRERRVAGRVYRYYADEGRRLGSVWSDCPAMVANTPLSREATGYPTQKPLKLLERIVLATTSPGDRVLDPMCGSGTTLVAATRRGRGALGIDSSPRACATALGRLAAPRPSPPGRSELDHDE